MATPIKVSGLPTLTTAPTGDDLLVIVDSPGSSPTTKQINVSTFFSNVSIGKIVANGSVGTANQVLLSNGSGTFWSGNLNLTTINVASGALYANSSAVYAATLFANVSAGYVNVAGQVNTATLYVTTSANVGTSFLVNSTALVHTGTVNAASHTVGSNFIANSTAIVSTGDVTLSGNLRVSGIDLPIIPAKNDVTFAPLSKSDPRVLVDIGISSLISKNTWTSLPTGWTLTSSTGTSVSSSGFIPGTGNQQNGRIQSPSNWNTTAAKQATIYVRLSRAAISANGNDGGTSPNNTTTAWWDSVGNPYGAFGGGWPPAVFTLFNSGGRYLSFVLAPTTFSLVDFTGSYQSPTISASLVNPSQISPNIDKDFVDLVVTWTTNDSNVTTIYIYVDSILVQVKPLTTNGALSVDMFRHVAIGNSHNGPNASLGGNLGPFTIQRFQISTAFCPPIPSRLLVGVTGDSYTQGGGGFGGDGGVPSVATYSSIYGNNSSLSKSTLYNSSYVFGEAVDQNPTSIVGAYFWGHLLQSFSARQLGIRPTFFSATKSGYANYFTGYQSASPRDNPLASTPLTIYTDALNSAKPPIVMELDSVNNQIQMNINNYLNTDCVGDLKWRYDYMAANNPNLRAIILIEAMSLERLPIATLSPYAIADPTNAATISAYWRNLLRAAFYTTKYYAGNRVPVIYVPTYEQCAGAPDGNLLFWGSSPTNSITINANGGPGAVQPDLHITIRGKMRIADIVWAALKPVMKAVLSNIDVEIPFASPFDQTSITPNCALGVTQIYTINGNATINAPINASSIGTRLRLKIIQNTTGGYTATFNSLYRNAPSWGTGLANKTAYAEFECLDVSTNTWQYIGGSTAFA